MKAQKAYHSSSVSLTNESHLLIDSHTLKQTVLHALEEEQEEVCILCC